MSLIDRAYEAYETWKGESGLADERAARDIFGRELRRAMGRRTGRILEIGFGEGRFLDVAREAGNTVWGVEVKETYLARAKARGHAVHHGSIATLGEALPRDLDAVFLFDVLEHMDEEEIDALLGRLAGMVVEGGLLVARFPNGASPFFGRNQFGDLTHKSILSALKLQQLGLLNGWRLVGAHDELRSHAGGRLWGVPSRLRWAVAKSIGFVLSHAFLGYRHPMMPNVVVHLRRVTERDA